MNPRKYLGYHTLIDFYECDSKLLNNISEIREIMLEAIKMAKIASISDNFHEFSPQGVTGVILLKESHFSVHTWPEYSYAALDLFTCGQNLEMSEAYTYLKNKFGAKRMSIFRVERGVMSEIKFEN